MHSSKRFIFSLFAVSLLLSALGVFAVNAISSGAGGSSSPHKIKFFQYSNGLAAGGYDVVAYFTDSEAQPGDAAFAANFAGMAWHFASAANRDAFLADPQQYLPQYGGHCAYGVAQGYLVRGDPEAWSIKDGRLYLNYNKSIRSAWLADSKRFIARSANNWPQLNK